jgi:hypothetical protein
MRENRSSGSVRGASGDGRPYRERVLPVAEPPGEGRFSIAASVKLRPDDFMLAPFRAPANQTTRGSRFSPRSASGRLMMG